jgi:hypothetical protein
MAREMRMMPRMNRRRGLTVRDNLIAWTRIKHARMEAFARKAEPGFDGLSLDELAALIGEEPHKLQRFVLAGVIAPDRDGRFAIVESVEAYWLFWRGVIREVEGIPNPLSHLKAPVPNKVFSRRHSCATRRPS